MSLNSNQSTSREKSNREGVSYRWLFVILGFFVLWVGTNFVFSQSDKEKKPWNPNDSSMSSSADKAARSSTLKKGTKSVSAVPEELKREREIRADALNAPAPTQSTSSVSETATTSAPVTAPAEAAAEEKNYYLPDYEPLPSKKLSLDESIQKSLEQNLDIKIKSTDRSIADDQKRQALGQFNPTLKFDGNYEEIDRSQNTQDFVSTGGDEGALRLNRQPRLFQEKNYRTKLSLEGELPTGTKYELFTKMDVLSNTLTKTSPSALYDHEYQSFTGFSLTQPLLKGFGTDVGMTQIRVARKNQQISQQEFRSQMLETVATTLQTYYDVIYLAQDFRLKQEEVKLARRLTEEKRRL
ncbi:MAG: TolC family protein, partial [Verrucomicrobiota bacterium]